LAILIGKKHEKNSEILKKCEKQKKINKKLKSQISKKKGYS